MPLAEAAAPDTEKAVTPKPGLEVPMALKYWTGARLVLRGDLGQSLVMERPIAPMLWDAFGKSAILAVTAMAVVALVGPPPGGIAAGRGGPRADHHASIVTHLGHSLPHSYWVRVRIL